MIKVQTRENSLKETAHAGYIFVVSSEDSLTVADICRWHSRHGGTVPVGTMIDIVNQYFAAERDMLLEGKMVKTPNYYARVCAHGTTTSAEGP